LTWTGIGLICLACIGGMAIATSVISLTYKTGASPAFIALALLSFILIAAGILSLRMGGNPSSQGIARLAVRTLAVIGALIAVPILTAFAALIVLLAMCAAPCGSRMGPWH
jgi:hypothetical protein